MKDWKKSRFFHIADQANKKNSAYFLSMIDKNPNARLLDLGCHSGGLTLKIAQNLNTKQFYGIELDYNKAERAYKNGVKVIACDANASIPFIDNFFDIVTANQVLEHLYNTDNFFREIYRLLKKGGYAVISVPNICSWHNIFFMFLGMQPPGIQLINIQVGNFLYGTETHGHIKLFSLKAIKDIVKYYGFKIEKIITNGYYPFSGLISDFLSDFDKAHALYFVIKIRKI